MRKILLLLSFATAAFAQDAELTNYRTGISVTFGAGDGSDKGTAYYEEYFYHDKPTNDAKVVYLKADTLIRMEHNALNRAFYRSDDGGNQVIGVNGRDDIADTGDEGIIRYKIDRDRQDYFVWAAATNNSNVDRVLPEYTAPFALEDLEFEAGVPVVGTTGGNGGNQASKTAYYYRGILDTSNVTGGGDEWHVLSYADDDNVFLRARSIETGNFIDQKFYASDARTILLVVNPKTPCFTARVTGTGQFYTTPPKAYWTPKIVPQTTYIAAGASGTVTIELRDINGNNVFYRINGGSYIDAGSETVTLDQGDFSAGTNTLEYYYAGNAAYTKTRIVVKDPTHPSAGEAHGNYLWEDTDGYNTVLSRITRAPYLKIYNNFKTRTDFSGSDQANWDARVSGSKERSGNNVLNNTFIALVDGFTFTKSGQPKSYGEYAKEMLIQSSRSLDPVGFEVQMSSGASGNREMHAFGYYDSVGPLASAFAYDIFVANFRDDQVTGGLTAIENYFVRDCLANFAYEAMQWTAGHQGLGSPEMWGGARIMTAVSIAIILSEYSTPYYGTSGFGAVQTTYPLCPYESDEYTWKEAMFDGQTRGAYPDFTWNIGMSDNGLNNSLFFAEGEAYGGNTFELGDFKPKTSYFPFGQMGRMLMAWANMAKIWGGGKTDPRLEAAITKAVTGDLRGGGNGNMNASRFPMLAVLNERWPEAAAANTAWVQSLASTDNNSDDKQMDDAGVLGFAWYDDTYFGEASDTTPPSPSPSTFSSAPVISGTNGIVATASETTDVDSAPVSYRFSVVEEGQTTAWGSWQESPVLLVNGLSPSTTYDVRVQARDAVGNTTTESSIVQVTTAAPDTSTRRSLRSLRVRKLP